MLIDAHHHLWHYDPVEYGWIDESMQPLRKDFALPELERVAAANGVTGTVAVQARQTLAETDWLLDLSDRTDLIRGVVGWVPLCDPGVESLLAGYQIRRKLKGVRHVVQAEPEEDFLLRPDFNRGVSSLRHFGLVYDILIYERQLPQTIKFVDRHPDQAFVLDHVAKPKIRDAEISPWREQIQELAKRENVSCKLSGMVTEADWSSWTEQSLRPYWDVVVDAFGPERLMFGSDWPVVLAAAPYERWLETVRSFVHQLSADEQNQIWSETARQVYGF